MCWCTASLFLKKLKAKFEMAMQPNTMTMEKIYRCCKPGVKLAGRPWSREVCTYHCFVGDGLYETVEDLGESVC